MKGIFIITFLLALTVQNLRAQEKYYTNTGHVYFISRTDILNIEGTNDKMISFININTGEMIFGVKMKAFEFKLPLAEEHFNENYVESEKYPNAKFKGKILNFSEVNLKKEGKYEVEAEGDLEIHGVTRKIKEKAMLLVKENKIVATCSFSINISDYNIKVPKLVEDKVAKEIPIELRLEYIPYKSEK
ncbi:MAG: hypothetical protein A2W91_03695 [Bacteroidetes bacterium GWF2_38_335]|nr:MAG: hypothetical protein A2W91_03695 [Bacteroidetes bacterium GWF2_38_335]OFY77413.1 MAG: hypothetical protein A2281_01065 [Bacteroidetes bacterium RIFOXYA12_FULL_38_20]HBS87299.1 YceI family protein [Bacteroidales bacterium]